MSRGCEVIREARPLCRFGLSVLQGMFWPSYSFHAALDDSSSRLEQRREGSRRYGKLVWGCWDQRRHIVRQHGREAVGIGNAVLEAQGGLTLPLVPRAGRGGWGWDGGGRHVLDRIQLATCQPLPCPVPGARTAESEGVSDISGTPDFNPSTFTRASAV